MWSVKKRGGQNEKREGLTNREGVFIQKEGLGPPAKHVRKYIV